MAFESPSEDEVRQKLKEFQTIAMVGLSAKPERESNGVAHYLVDHGYDVVPVNPTIDTWEGRKAYPDLRSAKAGVLANGGTIDVVDVFRAPEHVPEIVDEVEQLRLPALWLQLGVIDEEAAKRAQDAGAWVVMDQCMRVEHSKLIARAEH